MESVISYPSRLRLMCALAAALVCTGIGQPNLWAQTFTVLHTFTGGTDGGNPMSGITLGGAGTIYGTASLGGINNNGLVFKMTQEPSGWLLKPIHPFLGSNDGASPEASVVFGPDGALYGTTDDDGFGGGGTVFRLTPPESVCRSVLCLWDETILHSFTRGSDGACPWYGSLTFDAAGNVFGTTYEGGTYNVGVAYELVRTGDTWAIDILHAFGGGDDGTYPQTGLTFDGAGNLYGTATFGGTDHQCVGGCGVVYELTPGNGGWTENILTNFDSPMDGVNPIASLTFDRSGNLYGTTSTGGSAGGGTVFKLSSAQGEWAFSTTYSFSGQFSLPSNLTADAAGNFYGATVNGGRFGEGMVFKLTNAGGSWTFSDLHDFTGGVDGANPVAGVVIDNSGNLYGTAFAAGQSSGCTSNLGCGVVWEITPN